MNKFFWLSLAVTASLFVAIPSHALPASRTESTNTKSSVRIIPQSKATGTQAQLQTVEVWPGHGVSISFYETGEVIQRVWLDDSSRILIDVDGWHSFNNSLAKLICLEVAYWWCQIFQKIYPN